MTDPHPGEHELYVIAKQLRYDLTAMQAKVTTLLQALGRAKLPTPQQHTCPDCGLSLRSNAKLEEHAYHTHNGPIPTAWENAASRADAGAPARPDIAFREESC